MSITIVRARVEDATTIQALAETIWPLVYDYMISSKQIDYMLRRMYSAEVLMDQMQNGVDFSLVYSGDYAVGFVGQETLINPEGSINQILHKLYLHPSQQGKGVGNLMMQYVIQTAREKGACSILLNVNKNNRTISFYKQQGFSIIKSEIRDIENGFVMDDYVMEKKL